MPNLLKNFTTNHIIVNSSSSVSFNNNNLIVLNTLAHLEYILQCLNFTIHLIYILTILISKHLRTRTLLYVNHATIVSIIYVFIRLFITNNTISSSSSSHILESILVHFSIYIRMWSILLIAAFRCLAVFNLKWYRRVSTTNHYLFAPLALVWLVATLFPTLFAKQNASSIIYFGLNYSLMILAPSILIVAIYVAIMRRLGKMLAKANINTKRSKTRVNVARNVTTTALPSLADVSSIVFVAENVNNCVMAENGGLLRMNLRQSRVLKNRRFNSQFIVMSMFVILTAVMLSVFQIEENVCSLLLLGHKCGWLQLWWWAYVRVLLEMFTSLTIAAIPLVAIYYHPQRPRLFRMFKLFLNKCGGSRRN